MDEMKKHVDESWKDAVAKEKETPGVKGDSQAPIEVTFGLFITGLMMEALISLGDLENPVTHKKEANIQHAKLLIDTIEMLQHKTKGNLDKDEEDAINSMLYDLRMRFVAKSNKKE
ncbi:MAG: DUF1844 domain-containing protein [Candidatus Omnitrophota bacterium]|nr:DUF1844 domain-containing protein [Candidatus Omnitrophota bacterium]